MPKLQKKTIVKKPPVKLPGAAHDPALHKAARALYWQRWRIADIAQYLQVPRTTVHDWKAA
jgi:transcriptional regulator of acetoin/glycerol metabolism